MKRLWIAMLVLFCQGCATMRPDFGLGDAIKASLADATMLSMMAMLPAIVFEECLVRAGISKEKLKAGKNKGSFISTVSVRNANVLIDSLTIDAKMESRGSQAKADRCRKEISAGFEKLKKDGKGMQNQPDVMKRLEGRTAIAKGLLFPVKDVEATGPKNEFSLKFQGELNWKKASE